MRPRNSPGDKSSLGNEDIGWVGRDNLDLEDGRD